jgi:hypothetical protein
VGCLRYSWDSWKYNLAVLSIHRISSANYYEVLGSDSYGGVIVTTSSAVSGLPLPENTDILDANGAFGGYANGIDTILVPKFTSVTNRTYPAGDITKPPRGTSAGQLSVITGTTVNEPTYLQMCEGADSWKTLEQEVTIHKPVDTARASTTTLTADPHLSVVLPIGVWSIEAFLAYSNPTIGVDYKHQWTLTGSATFNGAIALEVPAAFVAPPVTVNMQFITLAPATVYATQAATNALGFPSYRREQFTVQVPSGSGTLALTWAQNTSNASATTLLGVSFMSIRPGGG